MKTDHLTTYNFAVLRAVPHVHLGAFTNVGVIVYASTLDYLGIRIITDAAQLRRRVPETDVELLERYLESYRAVCEGDANAGPIALDATSERFHWITSPRSDVLQCSPVHEGISDDPRIALDELFNAYVGGAEHSRREDAEKRG